MRDASADNPDELQQQKQASAAKQEALRRNRGLLDRDLVEGNLRFGSKPRVAELQLSNFCNMSCTMCYDGNNPPMKKMTERVIRVLEEDVLPTASVLSPFVGSEPLIITWDLARGMAERHELTLDVITNAQYLTEERFRELEPLVNTVTFSIDSHLPDVYERIRLRAKTKAVFENLPAAAKLCLDHGIEPQANIVFMVENAPFLDETVAYLADQGCTTVRILSLLMSDALTPDRVYSDALQHMSPEWVSWMLGKVEQVARDKQINVSFEGQKRLTFEHRGKDKHYRPDRRTDGAIWDELPYFFPGYCVQSVDHLKVHADGDAYPCCVAADETLKLGNLETQEFDAVWNGAEAQDLRRAMLTQDLPDVCKECTFHKAYILPEQAHMPVVYWYDMHHAPDTNPAESAQPILRSHEPAHMTRAEQSPEFRWRAPDMAVARYVVVLGFGGTHHDENRAFEVDGSSTSFRISDAEWSSLRPNVAWWWYVLAIPADKDAQPQRSERLRCLVRHQDIPRVAGSTLYQHDSGVGPSSSAGVTDFRP
ncbi:MAG: radical SAM protein [Planctomycetota bacterium]|nr:radical SAM protein [Planctomycetota bacterium]